VADFVASFSIAWKENWGVVDVFYVLPNQISKTPPSGEYLPKGSFMISGKKIVIKDAKTELALRLELIEIKDGANPNVKILYPQIICEPIGTIKNKTSNLILIKPSKSGLTKGKLAKELKSIFLNNSEGDNKKWVKILSLDDIILILPPGTSKITKKS
jgi:hypothetical protein